MYFHSPSAARRGKHCGADVLNQQVLALLQLDCKFVLRGGSMCTNSEVLYMNNIHCKYQLCTIAILGYTGVLGKKVVLSIF